MPRRGWMEAFVVSALLMAGAAQGQVYWKGGEPVPKHEDIYGTDLSEEGDKWLTDSGENYNEKWRKFRDGPMKNMKSYRADFEGGKFYLNTKDGKCMEYELQIVGSEGIKDRSWEWAWNNPGISDALSTASRRLIPIGEKYNLKYVTHGRIPLAYDKMAMFLGGMALKVNPEAVTAFRLPYDNGKMAFYVLLYGPPREVPPALGRPQPQPTTHTK
jgi:hypothetical protein